MDDAGYSYITRHQAKIINAGGENATDRGGMVSDVINGQVDIDGNETTFELVDGLEVRGHRLSVSGTVERDDEMRLGETVTLEAVVVGLKYLVKDGSVVMVHAARVVE